MARKNKPPSITTMQMLIFGEMMHIKMLVSSLADLVAAIDDRPDLDRIYKRVHAIRKGFMKMCMEQTTNRPN